MRAPQKNPISREQRTPHAQSPARLERAELSTETKRRIMVGIRLQRPHLLPLDARDEALIMLAAELGAGAALAAVGVPVVAKGS